ncbi:MAG: polysaccharide biosynthesis tyrosine autokinase [Mariprofundaceae bacterium]|nr:polysaccharide biosynthesis tyrosine autokinase [Mariprofundaceae bacterium]
MAQAIGNTSYELNLEEYWQVILRRRFIILFCAMSMGVFSWIFTWLNQPPPLYSSSASVKVEAVSNMADMLLRGRSYRPTDDMSTQLALIQSYALMERVAQRLKMIPEGLTSEEIRANPDYIERVLDLKDEISADQDGDSRIIRISVTSMSAEFARDLAQTVADEFRVFNIEEKNKRVFDAKKFIEQQLLIVGDRLKRAEEAARDYRQANNLSQTGSDSDVMSRLIADMEQEYRQAVARLNDLSFALKQLQERVQKGGWNYQAATVSGNVSTYFDELNKRLVTMALKHTELTTHFTDEHPQVRELREQASDILESMAGELDKQVSLTKRRMQNLQDSMDDTQKKYHGLPEQALDLQRLQRTVRINEELYDLLEKKYQEVLIQESEKVQEVSLVRPAMLSHARVNPVRTAQTAVAGFILGLVMGLIIALILETMDTSVGTIEEVEAFLEVPVIGFVPHITHNEAMELFSGVEGLAISGHGLERQMRLISHFSPPSTISEAYRSLRTNLLFSQGGDHRVILVSSATVKEGKSTIAANLAVVVAQQGARVLLIDGDMRKPMQHHTFGLKRAPGLSECLLGQMSWQDAIKRFSDVMLGDMGIDQALFTPGLDQLDILSCGRASANPPDLLSDPALDRILAEVREEYDMVIIDMPPLLHTTDAIIVASKVDGILLVYHIGSVVRGALKRVKSNIEGVGGKVLGVVLNGVRGDLSPDYSTYKMDRYYAYNYGKDEKVRADWFGQLQKQTKDFLDKGLSMIRSMLKK